MIYHLFVWFFLINDKLMEIKILLRLISIVYKLLLFLIALQYSSNIWLFKALKLLFKKEMKLP